MIKCDLVVIVAARIKINFVLISQMVIGGWVQQLISLQLHPSRCRCGRILAYPIPHVLDGRVVLLVQVVHQL